MEGKSGAGQSLANFCSGCHLPAGQPQASCLSPASCLRNWDGSQSLRAQAWSTPAHSRQFVSQEVCPLLPYPDETWGSRGMKPLVALLRRLSV